MIEWKEAYNLGIEEIDQQHKKLFEIMNRIFNALKEDYAMDKKQQALEILHELIDYTHYHFTAEEQYMQEIAYPYFHDHKLEHEEFIARINEFHIDEVKVHQNQQLQELFRYMIGWITNHILKSDLTIIK